MIHPLTPPPGGTIHPHSGSSLATYMALCKASTDGFLSDKTHTLVLPAASTTMSTPNNPPPPRTHANLALHEANTPLPSEATVLPFCLLHGSWHSLNPRASSFLSAKALVLPAHTLPPHRDTPCLLGKLTSTWAPLLSLHGLGRRLDHWPTLTSKSPAPAPPSSRGGSAAPRHNRNPPPLRHLFRLLHGSWHSLNQQPPVGKGLGLGLNLTKRGIRGADLGLPATAAWHNT
jgi:hypothetical protein